MDGYKLRSERRSLGSSKSRRVTMNKLGPVFGPGSSSRGKLRSGGRWKGVNGWGVESDSDCRVGRFYTLAASLRLFLGCLENMCREEKVPVLGQGTEPSYMAA